MKSPYKEKSQLGNFGYRQPVIQVTTKIQLEEIGLLWVLDHYRMDDLVGHWFPSHWSFFPCVCFECFGPVKVFHFDQDKPQFISQKIWSNSEGQWMRDPLPSMT